MEEKVKAYETEHQALLQQIKEKAAAINSIQSEVSEASVSVVDIKPDVIAIRTKAGEWNP